MTAAPSVELPELPDAVATIDRGWMLIWRGPFPPGYFARQHGLRVGHVLYAPDQMHAYASAAVAANRVVVDEAMVERACRAFYADDAWCLNVDLIRDFMRAALLAAIGDESKAKEPL